MHPIQQLESQSIYTVSEVTRDLKGLLEDSFSSLWISGEISNFKKATSGHFYFTLKDAGAQIAAVMFRNTNYKIRFEPEDGLEILVHGRVTVYEPRGQYQILIDTMEPKGLGALQLAFDQLKKRLEGEGLFDPEHKKPLPYLPEKVGIITSAKGAALHDMLTILKRRHPGLSILVHPVTVQGETAAPEIAAAILAMNERDDIDVIIVGRGGGSMEDLWAFNEEMVVRAIFASRLPIVSAVGHETDFTLADFVADLRAPTPSAAAELVVPEREALLLHIQEVRLRLEQLSWRYFSLLRERLDFLKKRLKHPRRVLEDLRLKLDDVSERLAKILHHFLHNKRLELKGLSQHLSAVSPLEILKRGYSIVYPLDGKRPLRSSDHVKSGDELKIKLLQGDLKVRVV